MNTAIQWATKPSAVGTVDYRPQIEVFMVSSGKQTAGTGHFLIQNKKLLITFGFLRNCLWSF